MTKRAPYPSQDSFRLWLWGLHACKAALKNTNRHCFRLLMTKSNAHNLVIPKDHQPHKIEILEASAISRFLPDGAVHQGMAMEVAPLKEMPFQDLEDAQNGVLIVLDQVTDPHNVGAILRTARALGALGVMMTERNAPFLGGTLAKAASGALELLPIWKVTNLARALDDLKAEGFWTVGLDEKAKTPLTKTALPDKLALIMGGEGEGLRRLTQEKCDFLVNLPTDPAFSTLNVSVATALALYELTRN